MKKILVFFLLVLSISLFSCDKNNGEDFRSIFEDGLIAAQKDGICGYINKEGIEVIELQYDRCGSFFDGEAIVELDGRAKLIDKEGNGILSEDYDMLYRDEVSKSILYFNGSKWGIMDKDGGIIVNPVYDQIQTAQNGLFIVKINGITKFIDSDGEDAFDLEFDSANIFMNGYAAVKKNGKTGFIDEDGKMVIDYLYDYSSGIVDGYGNIIVINRISETEYSYNLINIDNEVIISDAINIVGKGPLYAVRFSDGMKIYDAEGNLFSDEVFHNVNRINNRFIAINDSTGASNLLLNEDGTIKVIASAQGESYILSNQVDGTEVFFMCVMGQEGAVLYTEENTYNLDVDEVFMILDDELFIGIKDNLYGIIDKDNNIILEFEYDLLRLINNEYFTFMKESKMGLMDLKYNIVIDLKYDFLNSPINIYNFTML